jgi:hypothetical protein
MVKLFMKGGIPVIAWPCRREFILHHFKLLATRRDHEGAARYDPYNRRSGGKSRTVMPMGVPIRTGNDAGHRSPRGLSAGRCAEPVVPSTATLDKITGDYAMSGRRKMIICPYPFCDSDVRVALVVRKSSALR